jgi:hypothetical protein
MSQRIGVLMVCMGNKEYLLRINRRSAACGLVYP